MGPDLGPDFARDIWQKKADRSTITPWWRKITVVAGE